MHLAHKPVSENLKMETIFSTGQVRSGQVRSHRSDWVQWAAVPETWIPSRRPRPGRWSDQSSRLPDPRRERRSFVILPWSAAGMASCYVKMRERERERDLYVFLYYILAWILLHILWLQMSGIFCVDRTDRWVYLERRIRFNLNLLFSIISWQIRLVRELTTTTAADITRKLNRVIWTLPFFSIGCLPLFVPRQNMIH